MKIYNRWGQLLFESDLPNANWDGRTNAGDLVPQGTYFYVIIIQTSTEELIENNGYFTILR